MAFHAGWFLADETEASAIQTAAAAGERPPTNWPHLVLTGVDGMDVNQLEKLLRPKSKGKKGATGGKLLVRGKLTDYPVICVSRVAADFLDRLAALTEEELAKTAAAWQQGLTGLKPEALRELVDRMAIFAQEAGRAQRPVLQLDVV